MVGAPARRCQVRYAHGRGVSIRRACALMSVARSTLRYESRLVKRDAPAVGVMRELAAQYPATVIGASRSSWSVMDTR